MVQSILREIANRDVARSSDLAGVWLDVAGYDLEQRCLPSAIRSTETDALAGLDMPGDLVKQDTVAKRFV